MCLLRRVIKFSAVWRDSGFSVIYCSWLLAIVVDLILTLWDMDVIVIDRENHSCHIREIHVVCLLWQNACLFNRYSSFLFGRVNGCGCHILSLRILSKVLCLYVFLLLLSWIYVLKIGVCCRFYWNSGVKRPLKAFVFTKNLSLFVLLASKELLTTLMLLLLNFSRLLP